MIAEDFSYDVNCLEGLDQITVTRGDIVRTIRFYYDEPLETTESYYLEVIRRVADSLFFLASILAKDQIGQRGGFPDLLNVATPEQKESFKKLTRGIAEIEDPTLQQLLFSLEEQVNRLWELEDRLIDIVIGFLQAQTPRSKAERRRLQRIISRLWHKSDHLIWKGQSAYKILAEQTAEVWAAVEYLKPQIDKRVAYLESLLIDSEEQSEELQTAPSRDAPGEKLIRPPGWKAPQSDPKPLRRRAVGDYDPRVDEIINESIEERDPREAIKRLRYALRIDPSGALVASVYAHLGMKHEEIENLGWAIRYYSKALEASTLPWPILSFWRGRLYFQQGKWDKARHDFQESLSLPVEEEGIGSPEYEEALEYLAKLDELTGGS